MACEGAAGLAMTSASRAWSRWRSSWRLGCCGLGLPFPAPIEGGNVAKTVPCGGAWQSSTGWMLTIRTGRARLPSTTSWMAMGETSIAPWMLNQCRN